MTHRKIEEAAEFFAQIIARFEGWVSAPGKEEIYKAGFRAGVSYRDAYGHKSCKKIMSSLEKSLDQCREVLKEVLHARQCNAPYGQTEKYPSVEKLKRILKET